LHQKRHLAWKSGNWLTAPPQYHKPFSEIQFIESRLNEPLHWRKPQVVFVAPQSDLFHEQVTDDHRDKMFAVMMLAYQRTFLILTKRAAGMRDYMERLNVRRRGYWQETCGYLSGVVLDISNSGNLWTEATRHWNPELPEKPTCLGDSACYHPPWPLPNVWFGVSVCGPEDDEKISVLLNVPAAHRWLSLEPLLGPIDFTEYGPEICFNRLRGYDGSDPPIPGIDAVVAGCESGPGARPTGPNWFRDIRDACAEANVPFYLKQMMVDGKLVHLPYLDGRQYTELPWRKEHRQKPERR
jgi:protein gp37